MYYKTYRNPPRRFAAHRRVTRRHLHNAAFGNATTVSAFIIWLIAFFSLWILILQTFEDTDIYNWTLKHLLTGEHACSQLDTYRQENGGELPESLEAIGFTKGYDENSYYFKSERDHYVYTLEYIRLNDTSYCLNFGDGLWFKGQYLSSVGHWNLYNTRYDSETCKWVIDASDGEDASAVYLYEYEIPEWFNSIRMPLDSIVHSDKGRRQQRYMLRICDRYESIYDLPNDDGTIRCIEYNCILQTFTPMPWPEIDYFRDITGYIMLDGKVCFIADETLPYRNGLAKRTNRGQVFKVPDKRSASGGERYWYLDIDRNYGGKATVKGVKFEE